MHHHLGRCTTVEHFYAFAMPHAVGARLSGIFALSNEQRFHKAGKLSRRYRGRQVGRAIELFKEPAPEERQPMHG